jgi:hypothetical protein
MPPLLSIIFDIKHNIAKLYADVWFLFYLYDDEFREFAMSSRGINEYINAFTTRTVSVYGIEYCLLGKLHNNNDLPAVITNNGDLYWYSLGLLHRCDGPAIIMYSREEWWQNGTRHRDGDLPAVITNNGDLYWYSLGLLHRCDGPAIIMYSREEWWQNGTRHRDGDLPAIITRDQSIWYTNGRIHRDGGEPAIIEKGRMEWYITGERQRLSQSRIKY